MFRYKNPASVTSGSYAQYSIKRYFRICQKCFEKLRNYRLLGLPLITNQNEIVLKLSWWIACAFHFTKPWPSTIETIKTPVLSILYKFELDHVSRCRYSSISNSTLFDNIFSDKNKFDSGLLLE